MLILPYKSSTTWVAFVGLGLPEVLALGAAIGTFANSIIFKAILLFGILIATVDNPPVILSGTLSLFLNIKVRGPGQNFSIISNASSGISFTNSSNCSLKAI